MGLGPTQQILRPECLSEPFRNAFNRTSTLNVPSGTTNEQNDGSKCVQTFLIIVYLQATRFTSLLSYYYLSTLCLLFIKKIIVGGGNILGYGYERSQLHSRMQFINICWYNNMAVFQPTKHYQFWKFGNAAMIYIT